MDPMLVEIDRFMVAGLTVRTTNAAEADPGRAAIPGLWGRFFGESIGELAGAEALGPEVFGVYWGYESDALGAYNVTAGVSVTGMYRGVPGCTSVEIDNGLYLAFHATGAPQKIVPETWSRIWENFSKPGLHRRKYTTDFERYEGQESITIFIAVEVVDDVSKKEKGEWKQ